MNFLSRAIGLAFIISDCLGMHNGVNANGIVHGIFLVFKNLDSHKVIDEQAVIESLEDAIVEEERENAVKP